MLQKMEIEMKEIWNKAMALKVNDEERAKLIKEYYRRFEAYKKQRLVAQ